MKDRDRLGFRLAVSGTIVAAGMGLIGPGAAAGAAVSPRVERAPGTPVLQHLLGRSPAPSAAAGSGRLPVRAKPGVHLFHCQEAEGGRCGTVKVPLDRANPKRGKVKLFFEYFRHRSKGPSHEAILVSEGGPGYSVTQAPFERQFYRDTFDPLLRTRDLILLDQRGVGRSQAINCKGVQRDADLNSPDIVANVAACAKQLGFAASLYGSGTVALDIDAVRRKLGIAKLDLYGGSYAAQDVQSYAARFPRHVRSAVLDSPVVVSKFDAHGSKFDEFATDLSRQGPRVANLVCSRSRSCSAERGSTYPALRWLAHRLRKHPLDGKGYDADGHLRHVHVTEGFLGWNLLLADDFNYTAASEIAAAAGRPEGRETGRRYFAWRRRTPGAAAARATRRTSRRATTSPAFAPTTGSRGRRARRPRHAGVSTSAPGKASTPTSSACSRRMAGWHARPILPYPIRASSGPTPGITCRRPCRGTGDCRGRCPPSWSLVTSTSAFPRPTRSHSPTSGRTAAT